MSAQTGLRKLDHRARIPAKQERQNIDVAVENNGNHQEAFYGLASNAVAACERASESLSAAIGLPVSAVRISWRRMASSSGSACFRFRPTGGSQDRYWDWPVFFIYRVQRSAVNHDTRNVPGESVIQISDPGSTYSPNHSEAFTVLISEWGPQGESVNE